MKKTSILILSVAFVCGSGFFKKDKDGNYAVDTASIEKQAGDVKAQAAVEADKLAKKAEASAAKMQEQVKKAAEKYNVKEEEILADLGKSTAELKTKVANMDKAKVVAYLSKYKDVFAGTEGKIAEYKEQVKNLKWTQKYSAKGKELKSSLNQYNNQFKGLKTQASVYVDQLEGYGINLADYGVDLSKYGL